MLVTLQYVLNSFFGGSIYFFDLRRFQRVEMEGLQDSSEKKYLNFVRPEVAGSSQDCMTVYNSIWRRVRAIWRRVRVAKISDVISILIGIISYVYVMRPFTKCWTVT